MTTKPIFSALFGAADAKESILAFNDDAGDLNRQHSIKKIEFNTGWVLDGFRVTYNTQQGERQIIHGTFNERNVGNQIVTVGGDEFISKVDGIHGGPNGDQKYGDCIQKLQLTITNSKTKAERNTGYFGKAENLDKQNGRQFSWEGRLFAFAGRADNSLPQGQVGLKGLSFGKLASEETTTNGGTGLAGKPGDVPVANGSRPNSQCPINAAGSALSGPDVKLHLAISAPYGGGRSAEAMGADYDDMKELSSNIDFTHPIHSIDISWGAVIDGISITYNQTGGKHVIREHGSKDGPGRSHQEIKLAPSENIIEVSGVQGHSVNNPDWGYQVTRLSVTILDSDTGLVRSVGILGTGQLLIQESRQDILVRGPLAGLTGTANNNAKLVGLNKVQFYTVTPS